METLSNIYHNLPRVTFVEKDLDDQLFLYNMAIMMEKNDIFVITVRAAAGSWHIKIEQTHERPHAVDVLKLEKVLEWKNPLYHTTHASERLIYAKERMRQRENERNRTMRVIRVSGEYQARSWGTEPKGEILSKFRPFNSIVWFENKIAQFNPLFNKRLVGVLNDNAPSNEVLLAVRANLPTSKEPVNFKGNDKTFKF
jgi:hypothetical protein